MPTVQTIMRPRYIAFWTYLSYMLAAVVFVLTPTEDTPRYGVGFIALFVWHLFLFMGSAISLVGVIRRHPAIEAIGIPLLASALLGYIVLLEASAIGPVGSRAGMGLVLISTILGLIGRMIEVLRLSRIATELDRKGGV